MSKLLITLIAITFIANALVLGTHFYKVNRKIYKMRNCVNFGRDEGMCTLGHYREKIQCIFTYDRTGFKIQLCEKL